MYVRKLSLSELEKKRLWLEELASDGRDFGPNGEKATPAVKQTFDLAKPIGRQIYNSFSDRELMDILHRHARRFGYSPSQREIFWIYRLYIRQRFGNWPKALRQAGLCVSTGRDGLTDEQLRMRKQERRQLLQYVRGKAAKLRRIPHPHDIPEALPIAEKYFSTWFGVLYAANVKPSKSVRKIENLEPEYVEMLAQLRDQAERLGRPPLRAEVHDGLRLPLTERCGSWRNALFQIGLEPVLPQDIFSVPLKEYGEGEVPGETRSLEDCNYMIINPDKRTQSALEALQRLERRLGRAPRQHEAPKALQKELLKTCGSWSNAVYQLYAGQPESA